MAAPFGLGLTRLSPRPLADGLGDEVVELLAIDGEGADTFGGLLRGHGVFVMVPAEILFAPDLGGFAFRLGGSFIERLGYAGGVFGELLEEVRSDGQEVATAEGLDLAAITEGGAHDFSLDAVTLVIGEDAADGLDAGIVGAGGGGFVPVGALSLLVPVVDTADERRDQLDLGVGAGDGLGERAVAWELMRENIV